SGGPEPNDRATCSPTPPGSPHRSAWYCRERGARPGARPPAKDGPVAPPPRVPGDRATRAPGPLRASSGANPSQPSSGTDGRHSTSKIGRKVDYLPCFSRKVDRPATAHHERTSLETRGAVIRAHAVEPGVAEGGADLGVRPADFLHPLPPPTPLPPVAQEPLDVAPRPVRGRTVAAPHH